MSSEFDQYADDYREQVQHAVSFSGQETEFFARVKVDHLLATMRKRFGDISDSVVLDVGCGVGEIAKHLIPDVGQLHGIDVASEAIDRAARSHPNGDFQAYDGHRIPFDDASVDVSFAICVMHHVAPEQWLAFLREMRRVTKPDGIVAIYEHNPFNPLTQLVVSRCEFDADAVLLGRGKVASLFKSVGLKPEVAEYLLFFPFRNTFFRSMERGLSWLPLGAQHVVMGSHMGD